MPSSLNQGRLISWQDKKGFGFIKPNNGGKDIFLHINQMKRMKRRPQVGDVIFYSQSYENGKSVAVEASIMGAEKSENSLANEQLLIRVLIGSLMVAGMLFWDVKFGRGSNPPLLMSIFKPECNIKGNISHNIYHLPGMKDYGSTVINLSNGERWFCTETEAIRNGWSKAPR